MNGMIDTIIQVNRLKRRRTLHNSQMLFDLRDGLRDRLKLTVFFECPGKEKSAGHWFRESQQSSAHSFVQDYFQISSDFSFAQPPKRARAAKNHGIWKSRGSNRV